MHNHATQTYTTTIKTQFGDHNVELSLWHGGESVWIAIEGVRPLYEFLKSHLEPVDSSPIVPYGSAETYSGPGPGIRSPQPPAPETVVDALACPNCGFSAVEFEYDAEAEANSEPEIIYDPSVLTDYGVSSELLMKLRSVGLETLQSIVANNNFFDLPCISIQESAAITLAIEKHLAEQAEVKLEPYRKERKGAE